jgi:hypothetical protein
LSSFEELLRKSDPEKAKMLKAKADEIGKDLTEFSERQSQLFIPDWHLG